MVFSMEHPIIFFSMDKEIKNFKDVLKDAQKLGYAELILLVEFKW